MTSFPAITELVPHAAPMLALDELVDWSPGHARARMVVGHDTLSRSTYDVDSIVTLEYMAQAVAACLGLGSYRQGAAVRVGMVIACRRMDIARPTVTAGEELLLEVRCVRGTDSISHYDTETRDATGALVSSATLTLVHGERPPD